MIKKIENTETLLIFSPDAARLSRFYKDQVGLTLVFSRIVGKENEKIYSFELNEGSILFIADATRKMKNDLGKNILNFEVEGIMNETRRLEDMGIKKIHDVEGIENFGYVSAFEDIDGNYFQLIEPLPIILDEAPRYRMLN